MRQPLQFLRPTSFNEMMVTDEESMNYTFLALESGKNRVVCLLTSLSP